MGIRDINITILTDSTGPQLAGFGVPLILSYNATWQEHVRFYSGIAGVATDFPIATSPEYLAANAMFAQNPAPAQIAIGRCANKPTQVFVVGIAAVLNSTKYQLSIKGQGVTPTVVSITSGGSATNDAIIASLLTAVNAVVGANFTATATGGSGSHVLTVTGNAAGNWFSIQILDSNGLASIAAPTMLSIAQTHVDPGVTADLTAIRAETDAWYAIQSNFNSAAMVEAIAAFADANTKIYLPVVNETAAITTAVSNGDTLDTLHTSADSRVMGMYYENTAAMADAAWLGQVLPSDPGSEDWKWHQLTGIAPSNLTDTHIANLQARNANFYSPRAGIGVTADGICADGEFLDTIRGRDWTEDALTKAIFTVFLSAAARGSKVPFTDEGVAMIEAAARAVFKQAVRMGIYADGSVVMVVPKVADAAPSDKSARILRNLKWSAIFAGSIHVVDGTLTVGF